MKFSIVVTVYQRENLVSRVLHCLAAQKHCDWEALFISDGPHPASKSAVSDFAKQTGLPVRYHSLRFARGCYGNVSRSKGLELAGGDFVCFVGHDCLIDADYLAVHAHAIERHGSPCLSVVQCRYWSLLNISRRRQARIERFHGIMPAAGTKPERFAQGGVDLTCIAFPRRQTVEAAAFGAAMRRSYEADWLAFDRVRKRVPVVFTEKIVCAHF